MLLIARRYLLSAKSHSVVNLIAGVSLLSLMIPVAAVIVLLSVFNGFGAMIGDAERTVEGDVTVRLCEGRLFDMAKIPVDSIAQIEGVEAMSFATEQSVMVEHRGRSAVVTLRGVDDRYADVVDVEESLYVGDFELGDGADATVVIGNELASKLSIRSLTDVDIELLAMRAGYLQSLLPVASTHSVSVSLSGVVMADPNTEDRFAYVSQSVMNGLLGCDGEATRLVLRVADGADQGGVIAEVEALVGDDYRVESRSEMNPAIHQVVRYEKLGVLLICTFVMLLASFSLLGAMTMLILEKRGDVETLRAMGCSVAMVKRVFIYEGLLIGGAATALGVVLGVGVTLAQQYFGLVMLPSLSAVALPYPVALSFVDLMVVVALAGGVTVAVSLTVVNVMVDRWLKKMNL